MFVTIVVAFRGFASYKRLMSVDIMVLGSINCTETCFVTALFAIVLFGLFSRLFCLDYIRILSYLVYSVVTATFGLIFF